MPDLQSSIPALAALGVATCGVALHTVAGFRLRRHLRPPHTEESADTPPLTLWRALKDGVPDLDEKLESLVRGSRDTDQILLGADPGSAELAACEALRARHPGRQIDIVACERERAANPKISKFIQMMPHARHAHWLLTDSEAMPEADFIESFRREWAASGADVQTAGYRFANLRNFPQTLDASPALLTLWPGLMLAGKITFTLGACTGVKAGDIRAIGGWEPLGTDLAEDHELGEKLTAKSLTIRLSRNVLTLDSDPMTWREYLRHQHRVAVTYRAATPVGALGLPVLHTLGFAAIAAALDPMSAKFGAHISLVHLAVVHIVIARIVIASVFSNMLRFPIRRLPLAILVSTCVETPMWLAAWLPARVWWTGRWRRVGWRGRLA